MNRLSGKSVVVTGGAVGIGRACVLRMAEEGARVAILDVLEDEGRALEAELGVTQSEAEFWTADVVMSAASSRQSMRRPSASAGLHVMVNNAGISGSPKPTDQVSEAEWDQVQAVNVKGVFFGTKHAIPHLRAAGGGSIINLSSIAGLVGVGGIAPYHASKGAVRLMSKNDAITYAPEKIRVNSIHPGYIWTPMVENHLRATSDDLRQRRRRRDRSIPSVTWANQTTLPGPWFGWHPMRRSSSPARRS